MHKPLFACVLGQSCTSLNFEEPRFFTQVCQECAFLHASPFSCKLSSACHCAAVDKKVVTFPNTLEKLVTCESESNDRYLSLVNYGLGKETPASLIFFFFSFILFFIPEGSNQDGRYEWCCLHRGRSCYYSKNGTRQNSIAVQTSAVLWVHVPVSSCRWADNLAQSVNYRPLQNV